MRFLREATRRPFRISVGQCAGTTIRSPWRRRSRSPLAQLLASSSKHQAKALRRPQQRRPSVLVAFVDEVLGSETCKLVPFAQFDDSVYGRANRLEVLFAVGLKRLLC